MNTPLTSPGTASLAGWRRSLHQARRSPLVWYALLSIGLTWAWWVPLAVSGRVVDTGWRPTHLPGQFGPLLAAIIVTGLTAGKPGLQSLLERMTRWRIAPRWWLAAISPLLFFVPALLIDRLVEGEWIVWRDIDVFGGAPEIGVIGVWLILMATTGFGEEVGWRGYALPRLQTGHPPLTASLLVAGIWIVWHLPAFWFNETYRDFNLFTTLGFFIGIIAGSVVLTWLYNRSGGSILAVAVWHGTYDLVSGTAAVEGLIAMLVSAQIIFLGIRLIVLDRQARQRGEPSPLAPG